MPPRTSKRRAAAPAAVPADLAPAGVAVLSRRAALIAASCLFAGALALYLATMAPGLTWSNEGGDGGDFLAAAHTWGVPHPTGYPTYIILLRTFSEVFRFGDEAFRGNLMSAVSAAVAVPLVFATTLRLLMPPASGDATRRQIVFWASVLAAAAFAVSNLHWSQATITEVYALNALFVAALLWLTVGARAVVEEGGTATAQRAVIALLLGLGLGNHVTVALVAAPFALWLSIPLWRQHGPMAVFDYRVALAFLAGLAVYVYAPLASAQDPAINWGEPHTFEGFRWMTSASIYQPYAFGVAPDFVPNRILATARLLLTQYTVPGTTIGLAGVSVIWGSRRGFAIASLAASLALVIYAIAYNTFDSFIYLIPAFMIFSIWIGAGAANLVGGIQSLANSGRYKTLFRWRAKTMMSAFAVLALAVPVWSLAANVGEVSLRSDSEARVYVAEAFATVDDGDVILATDIQIFALWYQSLVAEPERDVLVVATPLLQFDWYWEQLRRQDPERVPDSMPAGFLDRIVSIAQFNSGRTSVFLTDEDASHSRSFSLEKDGVLFRVTS